MRNSMMYDTLLQMGRWFGYRRSGYEDLCRVWMPEEAQGWYDAHFRFDRGAPRTNSGPHAGSKRQRRGLRSSKVRSHPDTLIVTARNKMGTGTSLRVHDRLGESNFDRDGDACRRDPAEH